MDKTKLTSHLDNYRFNCMLSGQRRTSATMQRAVKFILYQNRKKPCLIYIDDVVTVLKIDTNKLWTSIMC